MNQTKQLKAILNKCIACYDELLIHLNNLDKEISIIECNETLNNDIKTVDIMSIAVNKEKQK